MKSFMTACFFAFVATQIIQAQDCSSQEECPAANQCCAGIPFVGALCQNHTLEGGKCHIVDRTVPMFGDFIIGPCRCADGLDCVPTGDQQKNDGICQVHPTTPAPEVSEEPAGDSSAGEEPAGGSSAGEEPAGDSSAGEEPAGDSSAGEEPASDNSAGEEPAGDDTPAEETAADSSAAESAAEA